MYSHRVCVYYKANKKTKKHQIMIPYIPKTKNTARNVEAITTLKLAIVLVALSVEEALTSTCVSSSLVNMSTEVPLSTHSVPLVAA